MQRRRSGEGTSTQSDVAEERPLARPLVASPKPLGLGMMMLLGLGVAELVGRHDPSDSGGSEDVWLSSVLETTASD